MAARSPQDFGETRAPLPMQIDCRDAEPQSNSQMVEKRQGSACFTRLKSVPKKCTATGLNWRADADYNGIDCKAAISTGFGTCNTGTD
jgi:hypothetical protein